MTTPHKMWFFWSNPYKIKVIITSLIVTKLWSRDLQYNLSHVINFAGDVIARNYDVITFILKYLHFKNFANIIKIVTMFFKKIFKDSKKAKKNADVIHIFLGYSLDKV